MNATFQKDWDASVRQDINHIFPRITECAETPGLTEKFDELIQKYLKNDTIYPLSEDVMSALISMSKLLGRPDDLPLIDRIRFYSKCLDPDHSPHKQAGGFFEIVGRSIPGFETSQKIPPQELYEALVTRHPNIEANRWYIEILVDYAKQCETITELGVFQGTSAAGFLSTLPVRYRGYDLDFSRFNTELYLEIAAEHNIDAQFVFGNSHEIEIEPVDFLFIDTVHTYEHVQSEIIKHNRKLKKYISIHDTNYTKPPRLGKKVREAAMELSANFPEWHIVENIKTYTGMIILERS